MLPRTLVDGRGRLLLHDSDDRVWIASAPSGGDGPTDPRAPPGALLFAGEDEDRYFHPAPPSFRDLAAHELGALLRAARPVR